MANQLSAATRCAQRAILPFLSSGCVAQPYIEPKLGSCAVGRQSSREPELDESSREGDFERSNLPSTSDLTIHQQLSFISAACSNRSPSTRSTASTICCPGTSPRLREISPDLKCPVVLQMDTWERVELCQKPSRQPVELDPKCPVSAVQNTAEVLQQAKALSFSW